MGEHDIDYHAITSIKGQDLVDILREVPDNRCSLIVSQQKEDDGAQASNHAWLVYTDGAASHEGSGVGLILADPEGNEITYAFRFNINSTNNEAKYEALLAGIRLARKMGVKRLKIMVYSMLVTKQINVIYDTHNEIIKNIKQK